MPVYTPPKGYKKINEGTTEFKVAAKRIAKRLHLGPKDSIVSMERRIVACINAPKSHNYTYLIKQWDEEIQGWYIEGGPYFTLRNMEKYFNQ